MNYIKNQQRRMTENNLYRQNSETVCKQAPSFGQNPKSSQSRPQSQGQPHQGQQSDQSGQIDMPRIMRSSPNIARQIYGSEADISKIQRRRTSQSAASAAASGNQAGAWQRGRVNQAGYAPQQRARSRSIDIGAVYNGTDGPSIVNVAAGSSTTDQQRKYSVPVGAQSRPVNNYRRMSSNRVYSPNRSQNNSNDNNGDGHVTYSDGGDHVGEESNMAVRCRMNRDDIYALRNYKKNRKLL